MKARDLKTFPVGQNWMYEPKWDGFRCLVFRDEENIFLQSRTGKSLTSAFPEIAAAFQSVSSKSFVLDGELAVPTESGFSFDGLVNRLRLGSARIAMEARDSPAIYIAFDVRCPLFSTHHPLAIIHPTRTAVREPATQSELLTHPKYREPIFSLLGSRLLRNTLGRVIRSGRCTRCRCKH
jgi:hypothetical protein